MNDIASLMAQAASAFKSGEFARAREIAQRASRAHPGNAKVLQFLGIAQSKAGDPMRGLATLERALEREPDNSQLRLNAARAALDAGKYEVAERICSPIDGDPDAVRLLAEAAKLAGAPGKAAAIYRELAERLPEDAQVLNNLGNALLENGEAEEALAVLGRTATLLPDEALVFLNIGRAHSTLQQFEAAVQAFEYAIKLDPKDPQTNFELGKALSRHGLRSEALVRFAEAARGGIREPQIFVLIGLCYAALDQRDRAEESYRMALRVEPGYARAILALAIMYEQGNRLVELETLLDDARDKHIANDDVEYVEALVLRRQGDFEGALNKVLSSRPESLDSVVRSQFIGQVADRLGDIEQAFAAFTTMNEGMAGQPDALRYDGTEHRRVVAARTAVVTDSWYRGWIPFDSPDARPAPAFLGGFLRSGTTLLDTILMGHSETHVREEEGMIPRLEEVGGSYEALPALPPERIDAMRAAYFTELRAGGRVPPGNLVIDKYPLMTLRAGFINRAFPDAKFIFTLRHPCDVVLSCWMQNFRITKAMASFLTLENSALLYDAAMTHWERCRAVMSLDVHTVRYEDMVVDLESELRPLIAFLGLEWNDSLLDHQGTARDRGYIRTPSYAQVTERLYTRSSGRWEAYREQMAPVLPILAPWVERFGYEPI